MVVDCVAYIAADGRWRALMSECTFTHKNGRNKTRLESLSNMLTFYEEAFSYTGETSCTQIIAFYIKFTISVKARPKLRVFINV